VQTYSENLREVRLAAIVPAMLGRAFAIAKKKGGTEVPPSLGRKRPRKQQSKLMLQCII
jgi:hypothetical protein